MQDAARTPREPAVKDVHIVWITAGLGCDGDTVSVTAANQPSIEDILLGAIPGLPKVHLHNPVLAYEVGAEFLDFYYKAVSMATGFGGTRIVDMLAGEQLPRIC